MLVSNRHITDAGLVHLRTLTRLQSLGLSFSEVTDAGLVHLKRLRALRSLNLSGTKVTSEGIVELQKALPKCQISK
jgi:Leucine-rich repeat (LRR) protein